MAFEVIFLYYYPFSEYAAQLPTDGAKSKAHKYTYIIILFAKTKHCLSWLKHT